MKLTVKERKAISEKCIKQSAACEVERAIKNNYDSYYVETSLATLAGMRSVLYYQSGKSELWNFIDNCSSLIISRVSELPEFILDALK